MTVAVLAWVYRYRREAYPLLRNALALASLLAVVGYALFPTAPPRLAGVGIGDTVSGATSINLGSTLVSSLYNPYAAVPSMHVGFSLLVGAAIWRLGRRRLWQLAGLIYPVVVLFVIVATGNHFFLDAAAGAAVAAAAATLVAVAAAVRHRVRDDVHKPRLRLRERCQARPRSTDCRTPERRLSPLAEAVGCGQPECVFSIERSRSPAVGDELLRSSRSQAKRLSQQED